MKFKKYEKRSLQSERFLVKSIDDDIPKDNEKNHRFSNRIRPLTTREQYAACM